MYEPSSGTLTVEKVNGTTYVSCGIYDAGDVYQKRYATLAVARKVWTLIRRQLKEGTDRSDKRLVAKTVIDLPMWSGRPGKPKPLAWSISYISASGDVIIGCMSIPFSESMRIAQELHFEMDPS